MRHLWLLFAIGCGGGADGESLRGTVELQYGNDEPNLAVGAAIPNPENADDMVIVLGTNDIDCRTTLFDLDNTPPDGTFVLFSVDKQIEASTPAVIVMEVANMVETLDAGSGNVSITAIDERVEGNVSFATMDQTVGTIRVTGTFDVIRCF